MSRKLGRIAGRRVLVVEDEALLALDLTLILQAHGANVVGPSGTLKDAMDRIKETPPDGAILDVDLHGQSVDPVAQELTRLNIPYVLYSGHATLEPANETATQTKPAHKTCEPEKLIKRLVKLLSKQADLRPQQDQPPAEVSPQ